MKHKCMCSLCSSDAIYEAHNADLFLCEECYCSMSDDFEMTDVAEETGYSFDEYYEISEIED